MLMSGKIVQRSIAMTEEMRDRLQQLVSKHGREFNESDLIREAIRRYLEDQEAIIGSRRHFSKTLQERLERLETALTFHLNVLLYLSASGFSLLLQALTKQKVPAQQLIQNAIIAARKDASLNAQIEAVRDMPDQTGDSA
jgi:Arc/MetJ-type ribon-helix-helix transcriptional regulator